MEVIDIKFEKSENGGYYAEDVDYILPPEMTTIAGKALLIDGLIVPVEEGYHNWTDHYTYVKLKGVWWRWISFHETNDLTPEGDSYGRHYLEPR